MAFVIKHFIVELLDIWKEQDTRTDFLPFTSPLSVILIIGSYAYFIGKLGPEFMKNREPFELNKVIITYNVVQIIVNVWLFLHTVYNIYWYKSEFNFACQPADFTMSSVAMKEAVGTYMFYILKLIDLIDTVFFILRKKFSHVSFLHVYHHIAVALCTYLILRWSPGGHFIIIGLFNCLVHSLMYSYYLVSVFKPELKHNLEVKKIVTKIQIIQFGFLMYFFGRPLFSQSCSIPKCFLLMVVLQNTFLISLFADFYYKNYYKKNK